MTFVTAQITARSANLNSKGKAMAHKEKKGRKASQKARSSAAALVAVYGPTIRSRDAALALLGAWACFVENGRLPNESQEPSPHRSARRGKATSEARHAAQGLLDAYGPPLRSPWGTFFCLNPNDDEKAHITVPYEHAAQALLDAMARLANTGWLVETEVKLERFLIWEDFKKIRPKCDTTSEALEELSKLHPRSIRDLERVVSGRKWW
jgi:hypothetical protein